MKFINYYPRILIHFRRLKIKMCLNVKKSVHDQFTIHRISEKYVPIV
jgi:hypothetical protein